MSVQASTVMPVPPAIVFATLTNIGRLPAWNAVMTSVVDEPVALRMTESG